MGLCLMGWSSFLGQVRLPVEERLTTMRMIPHNQIADYSDIIYDHGVEQVPVKFIVEVCDSTYFDHVSRGHDFRGLDYINDLTDYMERNGFVGCGQLEYHLNGVLTY